MIQCCLAADLGWKQLTVTKHHGKSESGQMESMVSRINKPASIPIFTIWSKAKQKLQLGYVWISRPW